MRNKHRTVNGWSIGEAGSYAKEHIKRKKSKAADWLGWKLSGQKKDGMIINRIYCLTGSKQKIKY